MESKLVIVEPSPHHRLAGKKSVGEVQRNTDFLIKPEKVTPALDTSQWPLLLKVMMKNEVE